MPDQKLQTFNYTNLEDANTWLWDFGDGVGTSFEFEPEYTYTEIGEYEVLLVASFNHEGGILCSDSLTATVVVD